MFKVPAAKRLKRSELLEDHNDETSCLMTRDRDRGTTNENNGGAQQIPNYGFEYDFIDQSTSNTNPIPKQKQQAQFEDEAFQFNLFSASTHQPKTAAEPSTTAAPALISIRSPSPPPLNDISTGDLARQRPDSYYFTSALPAQTRQRLQDSYASSAISASTILSLSRQSWLGTSLPWRVVNLPANPKQVVVHKVKHETSTARHIEPLNAEDRTRRRSRPSKKRRLVTRVKVQMRQALIDESKTKEEHEREKKNRKNRERKLKRRAKERRERGEMKQKQHAGEDGDGDGHTTVKDDSDI